MFSSVLSFLNFQRIDVGVDREKKDAFKNRSFDARSILQNRGDPKEGDKKAAILDFDSKNEHP